MSDSSPRGQAPSPATPRSQPLFPLGQLLATPGALRILEDFGVAPASLVLMRHALGDWGDLDAEDQEQNLVALRNGCRIFSAYKLRRTVGTQIETEKLWVVTEADRSVTTILCPENY